MAEYTSEEKNRDAVAFLKTRFGKHYVARIKRLYKEALNISYDIENYRKDYREYCATRAKCLKKEIDYFELHKKIAKDPNIVARMIESARKRRKQKEI